MQPVNSARIRPKLSDYSDYRLFLRDYYNHRKQGGRFSFRRFAQLSKIKSSNYLMLVMDGRRSLSATTARSVAKAMQLTAGETEFFVSLVNLERAETSDERAGFEKDRRVSLARIIGREIPSDKAKYLSIWYYAVVRELAFLPDFSPKADWISEKMIGLIDVEQAEDAVRVLINLDLWKSKDGKIEISDLYLDSGPEERSFGEISVAKLHKQNLTAWCKILDQIPKSDRELGLIHIPINKAKVPELKKRIQKFQDEIIGWLQDETDPTQIVQVGTYMVPVTK